MKKKQKFIFLYLNTGGGHLAPAKSIVNYIEKNYSDSVTPLLVDGFTKTNKVVKYIIEDGYRNLQSKAKWYYELLYAVNKFPAMAKFNFNIVTHSVLPFLIELLDKEKPDKIFVFHFFLIEPVYEYLRKRKINIPVVTVVTDPFTAHPMWFLRKGQSYVVFSERLKNYINKKLPKSSVNVFPFILNEKFSKSFSTNEKNEIRNKFNFPPDKKIVLIMGGGDGIPHGEKILSGVIKSRIDASIIMVCGKNKSLYDSALRIKKEFNANNLFIFGFIDFIYELLNVSQIVITKCGASTMMEILLMKKIPVVNDYIWEQEKGNVEFLTNNDFGIYVPNLNKLPSVINKLLTDNEYYSHFVNNIQNAGFKNGLQEVADFFIGYE